MGSGLLLKRAIKKYGIENFKKEIIRVYKSEDEALNGEIDLIESVKACSNTNYYNIAKGGKGGYTTIGKTREELAEIHSKISQSNQGRKKSLQHRANISKSKIGYRHTIETRKRMSISQRGCSKPRSDEHASKIAKSRKENKSYPQTSVICLTTKKIFKSIPEASKFYRCDESTIRKCCKGLRKHCGSYNGSKLSWKYVKYNHKYKLRKVE